ncbi:dienelactone hydrolase family protein [Bradyrhizobium sp. 156]|uniref:dienelactone hydrolase family protein n=1 Tax=Bradyrhizobium sp. 156 TaxID=2782630 RepID=UPI0021125F21|nr:dienelactone hydrolase family protein [Bradyrhizobium sp. 156]
MPDGAVVDVYGVAAIGPRKGSLVLLQEIFGLTEHIREQCDLFADHGYDVVAPSLFDREAPGLEATYSPEDVERCIVIAREQHDFALTISDVSHVLASLTGAGPVFILGYCYGGSAAWAAACRCDGLTAAVSYYGSHVIRMVDETPRVPVLLHFGDQDAGIPLSDVARLKERHPYLPIQIYAARHGFNSDRREDYDATSAMVARTRSLAFFEACSTG